MKWFVIGAALCTLTVWFAYMEGRASVMDHTVVRTGTPIYLGLFFGKCAYFYENGRVTGSACATDDQDPPEKKP